MLFTQLGKCRHPHDVSLRSLSKLRPRRSRMAFDCGGEAMEVLNKMKSGLAHARPDGDLDVTIARPHGPAQARQPGIGLYRDAMPSPQVKGERRIVVDGVPGAYIDIESLASISEPAHKVDILEELRIGDE